MVVPLERLINMNTQKFKNINSFNLVSNAKFDGKLQWDVLIIIFLVFLKFTFMWLLEDQFKSWVTFTFIWLAWPLSINSESVVSSTNLWIMQSVLRSSIKTTNVSGPNRDPCGIDPDNCTQLEKTSQSLTRCWRSVRKERIQRIKKIRYTKINQFAHNCRMINMIKSFSISHTVTGDFTNGTRRNDWRRQENESILGAIRRTLGSWIAFVWH